MSEIEVRKRHNGNGGELAAQRRQFKPAVDIFETRDELLIYADLPGATADGIQIEFENNTLTLRAEIAERQASLPQFLLREYSNGDYFRSFEVTERIDVDAIRAELNDGVLALHLPKARVTKARTITVEPGTAH